MRSLATQCNPVTNSHLLINWGDTESKTLHMNLRVSGLHPHP